MNILRFISIAAISAAACLFNVAHAENAVLQVGTDATFPPMEFFKDNKRTGFDVDLVEAIGKVLNRRIEWVDIDFKGLIPGIVSHRFDIAIPVYITDERRKVVSFTDPTFSGGLVAMVKEGSSIKKVSDLDGKRVSVQVATKSVAFLQDHYPTIQRVEVEKNDEMFNLVEIGRADAVVTGKPAAYYYARTRPGLHVLDQQLSTEQYGMALRKDDSDLRNALNGALAKLKADGTYAAIVKKWFGAAN
jgi:polar amino acid transport system substrate-binding protein